MSAESNNTPLPKQELLIKLLGMTTSANDGEALVALRKATALLASAGWTWEKLIHGKITVVADPFASIATPRSGQHVDTDSMSAPSRPAPAQPQRPAPPPPRPRPQPASRPAPQPNPAPMPNSPISGFSGHMGGQTGGGRWSPNASKPAPVNYSIKPNRYEGYCFCCGVLVGQQGGFIFEPSKINTSAATKWQIICASCNQGAHIPTSPAPRQKVNHGASAANL